MAEKPTTEKLGLRIDNVKAAPARLSERVAEALNRREGLLALFLEHAPAAIAMCDREMKYIAYSRRWAEDYRIGDQNLLGRCHYDLFPDLPQHWREEHRRCLAGETVYAEEEPFPRIDGAMDWVKRELCPWRNDAGEIGGIVMFTQVVTERRQATQALKEAQAKLEMRVKARTAELEASNQKLQAQIAERKRAEADLRTAKESAEAANRAKSVFLANMSHELRTPLNHIIGFVELVVDQNFGALNKTQAEYLNDALSSSRHLLSLINDILDLSKVEAGKLKLELAFFNPRLLLENSLTMIKETAMKRGIHLSSDVHDTPETMAADELKLKQIIYKLLSNAVKFTLEGGTIHLSAKTGASALEISVADTGIGLKSEHMANIFKPFEQVENSASRQYQGTGLGLSLTKSLVELHGGRIWVKSEGEAKGSTFYFTLPI